MHRVHTSSFNSHVYCVLLHPCVKYLFYISSLRNCEHSFLVIQWGLIIVTISHEYIAQNNASLGFVTFFVMTCVSLLFDN